MQRWTDPKDHIFLHMYRRAGNRLAMSLGNNSTCDCLPDAGHYLFIDNPEGFNEWLTYLLMRS